MSKNFLNVNERKKKEIGVVVFPCLTHFISSEHFNDEISRYETLYFFLPTFPTKMVPLSIHIINRREYHIEHNKKNKMSV